MVGWHHQFNRHEFEQPLGDGEGQRGLAQSMGLQRIGHGWVTERQIPGDAAVGGSRPPFENPLSKPLVKSKIMSLTRMLVI